MRLYAASMLHIQSSIQHQKVETLKNQELLRGHPQRPLEDVLVVDPGAVVDQEECVHKASVAPEVGADPVVGALLAAQQHHGHVAQGASLEERLGVLQPLCGVGNLLLLTAVQY